jgi:hypothetical protein
MHAWSGAEVRAVHNRDMSSIISFFVAPDHLAATDAVNGGPEVDFDHATFGNFDVWSTLEEWEGILTNGDVDNLPGGSGVIAGGDDEPVVLSVSADLVRALADADGLTLDAAAERWTELRADEGETIHDELAKQILATVAGLCAGAVRSGGSLYCSIS